MMAASFILAALAVIPIPEPSREGSSAIMPGP